MKNVLVIVYYFPPMGGSGVQRPLKFVKYLREYGWNPIVLCPEPGAYHKFDDYLNNELEAMNIEVHRVHGNTPLHKTGDRKITLPNRLENLLRKISSFFWLPDNKKGWIRPGLKKAKELINTYDIEVVFSTAAPYSNLMLAAQLKEETGVKIVMDLRDEWLESHLIEYSTPWHRKKMAEIEKQTLSKADVITTINESYKSSFGRRFPEADIRVVNQGFDPGDFGETESLPVDESFTLLYSGLFYGKRTPHLFFEAVRELIDENPELNSYLKLQFQGGLNEEVRSLINEIGLSGVVSDLGYVEHNIAVMNLMKADALWLMIGHLKESDKVTLGKMFEYFGSRKPVLGLIPRGKSMDMLKDYGAAYSAHPASKKEIKAALIRLIADFKSNNIPVPNEDFIAQFDRKKITGQLSSIFDVITS